MRFSTRRKFAVVVPSARERGRAETPVKIFGSDRARTLQDPRLRKVTRFLRLDPFGIRRVLRQPIRPRASSKLARSVRRRMRVDPRESFGEPGPSDFTIGRKDLEVSMDLLALCRK
jgi:hypothetical protein